MNSKVLIIDDSEVDRKIINMIIKKRLPNYVVFESADGLNIKTLIIENNISVCILDLRMPQKDGYTILSELKMDKTTMDIPIIVCSGAMDTESLEKVLLLGAFDYFSKPLSEEALKISLPLKIRNAAELMKRTSYIVHLSEIDCLTGLYNRNFFKNYINNISLLEGKQNSILIGDINGLKLANDAFGSDIGDQFILEASKIIKRICPTDSICSRWGGDEFAVFIPNYSKENAQDSAYKIKELFAEINNNGLKLTISFGWDTQYTKEQSLLKLLINAEDAMIRSKILENVSIRSNMIVAILHTLHEKNPREEAHSRRVSELCKKMGKAMELSEKEINDLNIIGLIHDIGKIAISENILNKPGKLDGEEWLEIKRHPEIGFRILSAAPELKSYADIILCHHERIDGRGYPNGLTDGQIPLFSKMLSIIDSYDAMTCERTYRKIMTTIQAAEEIKKHSGSQFDFELSKIFIKKVLMLDEI